MEEREEKEIRILLVEDLKEHVIIIRTALEKSKLRNRVFVTSDGEKALDFLYNRGDYADEKKYPKPDIILLDLRLPKLDGLEVLEQIKREEGIKDIPVVVLTSSERDDDIIKTYEEGVKGYILKSAFIVQKATEKIDGLLDVIISLV